MLEFRLNAHFIRNYNTIEEMSGEPRTATHPLMFMGFPERSDDRKTALHRTADND